MTGSSPESPAVTLRRAAALMRKRAEAATPGPWERPLDVRSKAIVIAALPDDEEPRQYLSGIIPAEYASHSGPSGRYAGQRERTCVVSAPSNNITGFDRKRSGRDLEYIASMHPGVALAVAALLDKIAWMGELDPDMLGRVGCDEAIAIAHVFLGEVKTGSDERNAQDER